MNYYKILSLTLLLSIGCNSSILAQWWQVQYSSDTLGWGTSPSVQSMDVQTLSTGDYLVAGIASFPTGAPRDYPTLTKLDDQGVIVWNKQYFSANNAIADYTKARVALSNTGAIYMATTEATQLTILRLDAQGDTTWTKKHDYSSLVPTTFFVSAMQWTATADGNFVCSVGGHTNVGGAPGPDLLTVVYKIDPLGNVIWQKVFEDFLAQDIQNTLDNNYVIAGSYYQSSRGAIYKINLLGDSLRLTTVASGLGYNSFKSIAVMPDSGYIVATEQSGVVGNTPVLVRLDSVGNIGSNIYSRIGYTGEMRSVVYDATSQELIATGAIMIYNAIAARGQNHAFVERMKLDSSDYQSRIFGQNSPSSNNGTYHSVANSIGATQGGGCIMVGSFSQQFGYVVSLDSFLNSGESRRVITGNLFYDSNYDCINNNERGADQWVVQARNNNQTYYATTNSTGGYQFSIEDTSAVTVQVIAPNALWAACPDSVLLPLVNDNHRDILDFGVQAQVSCPSLTVDISTPFLRRCSTNTYQVQYCNQGTADALQAYITVDIDTSLQVLSSSIPYTQSGTLFTFMVDTVAWSDCGNFTIQTQVNCTAFLGQQHCVTAHIYPDSSCSNASPIWDGSDIEVISTCLGDSMEFVVKNRGVGAMNVARQYYVTEDHVMLRRSPYQLGSGDSLVFVLQTTGAAFRLQAEQDPNHPNSSFSATIQPRCYNSNLGTATNQFGVLGQYPEDDSHPAISIDCQQNRGSFDPNDKRAAPVGYGSSHAVLPNSDLEYHIRFQNTGTDTAFFVTVIDTLSTHLDPSTLVMGASSHAYTWKLKSNGVLVVQYDNILLPDSTTNLTGSNGFIKFKIAQKADLPLGTIIENQAAIVFDQNAAVLTNTIFHTVDRNFIIDAVDVLPNDLSINNIDVFPNPVLQQTTIVLEGASLQEVELTVVDALGRVVDRQTVAGQNTLTWSRKSLSSGVYFMQIKSNNQLIGTARMLLQ